MSMEIKVGQLPESVSDATLIGWHKKAGDSVSRDENLADLETDKVVLEVPAPQSGTLKELLVDEGATVKEGDVLAILEEGEVEASSGTDDSGSDDAPAEESGDADEKADAVEESDGKAGKTSPAVRRLLEEHDLDATMVVGSGKAGRITKSDVMSFLKSQEAENVNPGDSNRVPETVETTSDRSEQRVPMTRLRAKIAERMVEAQSTAAMLTTFNEVDLTEVMALRSKYKEEFEKTHDVRLGFMSFFAKASVEALKKFPVVNASVEGEDIVYHNYYDIGIAVSAKRGLMVPVIRDVDQLGFAEFEKALGDMAAKAQDGSIGMDDLTGGTFTITNGGIFGSMMSTPILNPPQSAILGMHNIQKRPMVVGDDIVARPMMYIALTYDHRIIDGREAVQFLVTIKQLLEDPGRLLLKV